MSPPTFLNLPGERRQQIFTCLFNEAVEEDLIFNTSRLYCVANLMLNGIEVNPEITQYSLTRVAGLATDLSMALPDLADDIKYVLGKSLNLFRKKKQAVKDVKMEGPKGDVYPKKLTQWLRLFEVVVENRA